MFTKIEVLNFDYAPLNIEVSSFDGGYSGHDLTSGECIFTVDTLEEAKYWLSEIEHTLLYEQEPF